MSKAHDLVIAGWAHFSDFFTDLAEGKVLARLDHVFALARFTHFAF